MAAPVTSTPFACQDPNQFPKVIRIRHIINLIFSKQGLEDLIDKLQRNDDFAFDPIASTIEGGSGCSGFKAIARLARFKAIARLARRLAKALLDLFAFILAAIL